MEKMTSGSIPKILLTLSGPILAGQILQQLYNIADSIIIGNFAGLNGLAAVGANWALNYILSYFCIGSCMAVSVPLSISYGADNHKDLRSYFFNGIFCAVILAAGITALAQLGGSTFLSLLNTPEGIFNKTLTYYTITMWGLPFTVLYNFCYGILMAFGDSRKASVFMAVSTVINVVLDLLFVITFSMDVAGAAAATLIAQAAAGIISALYIYKKYTLLYTSEDGSKIKPFSDTAEGCGKWNTYYVKRIIKMCLPMGAQYSITATGALVMQAAMNDLGAESIAAYSAGQKIKSFLLTPLSSLGTSLSAFTGQNHGAKRTDRIRSGVRVSLIMGCIYSAAALAVVLIIREQLAGLFVSPEETVTIGYIKMFITYSAVFNFLIAALFAYRYTVQGLGYGRMSIFSGLAEMSGRILSALFLLPLFAFTAVCISEGLTFGLGVAVIMPVYYYLIKRIGSK